MRGAVFCVSLNFILRYYCVHLFGLVSLLSYGSWLHYMLCMWCNIYAGGYATGDTHLSLHMFTFSLIIIVYVGWFV